MSHWCFLTSSMHLHVNAYCVFSFCSHVYTYYVHYLHILPIPCLCMVYRFCAWRERSVHCVQVLCMVCTFCAWCGRSVQGVHVLCMVWTFCAGCGRSVHGVHVLCMDAVSPLACTSQVRFQPLCIYMYMYIEVAVCHCIIIILQLQYNVCSSVRATELFCQRAN